MMTGAAIVVALMAIEALFQFCAIEDGMPLDLSHFFDCMTPYADFIGGALAGYFHYLIDID